ncbi:acetyltransferase (GNAT) family protein [Aneurinibacillus soli]|uniref:Acetyltransferase GNAT family protein n=2 Tax=Aneurinibacillus soli TaxID=1500254 RepID=A0A0U4NHI7_9BACL|nr:acetyltransferase (GNAT) family protein [Aneurinibacillus soli]BAU28212.1 acetyltransferase GNAT family protein [Aneurinibacillus soli]
MKIEFNFLEDLFGIKRDKFIPLKIKGDMEYELQIRVQEIENEGFKILRTERNKNGEIVIIYRHFFYDGNDEDMITIEAIVITKKGIIIPYPVMYVNRREADKSLYIADIRVFGESINKGYGSLMMKELLQIARSQKEKVFFVTGNMDYGDEEHYKRLIHFYEKYGFTCRDGKILWINDGVKLSGEQVDAIFSRVVLEDPEIFEYEK